MAPTYHLIGSAQNRSFRVLWLLEELGLSYRHTPALPRSEEARRFEVNGKVPALEVSGEVLHDSVAIMQYLADRHQQFTAPFGTLERAQQDAWVHRLNGELDALLWAAAKHHFVLPEPHRMPEIKASLRWEFQRNCDRIGAVLMERPYLLGEAPRVPDLPREDSAHTVWRDCSLSPCRNFLVLPKNIGVVFFHRLFNIM